MLHDLFQGNFHYVFGQLKNLTDILWLCIKFWRLRKK